MPSAWSESPPDLAAEHGSANNSAAGSATRPTRSSYVPPHLRNRPQGASPSPPADLGPHSPGAGPKPTPGAGVLGATGGSQAPRQPSAWGAREIPGASGVGLAAGGAAPGRANNRGGAWQAGGGASAGPGHTQGWSNGAGGGWGQGGGRSGWSGRDREVNPFANDEAAEAIFDQENTGINFEAYEDIPVETSGENVPPPVNTFAEIDLGPALNENIRRCKYIHDEAKKFSYQTGIRVVVAYGGAPVQNQLREMEKGVDILVATPGRLGDLLERARVSLSMVKYLALDEADRMLDMGFEPQIRRIVEQMDMPTAGQRQTMLFSATFPREIQRLAADFLSNYIFLAVGRVGSSTDLIVQRVEFVADYEKRSMLMDLIHAQAANQTTGQAALTLVFVETKRGADALEDWLCRMGFPATTIHGDRSQTEREQALRSFRTGQTPILVATDVAARGLDIPHVAHVVNFDLPNDIDDYVHRIGRTGRAGKSGLATAFFNEKDTPLARPLSELMTESNQEVPNWLAQLGSRAALGGGGRNRRSGGGSRFGGRDYRREGGGGGGNRGGGDRHGGGGGYGGNSGGYGGYGGSSSAWD
ncbi:hypothetical protein AXG93_3384s1470 [Marchantia polymorpha subsp. ruderalis]|uniref:RNA helicase n=1 Tax=Marchantia polymorpha subsp. ruderalis TaxID=1480154 RepID=A0A176WGC9_MARPO|nr:hypothetical protein AXG93_3384s1470 [Marchantia polymorpha subsp. ruderalis]